MDVYFLTCMVKVRDQVFIGNRRLFPKQHPTSKKPLTIYTVGVEDVLTSGGNILM